jgi:hypothetical protein
MSQKRIMEEVSNQIDVAGKTPNLGLAGRNQKSRTSPMNCCMGSLPFDG